MKMRTRCCPGAKAALACFAFAFLLGMVMSVSPLEAGMENVRFAMHYKPKPPSKAVMCDDPSTPTEEANYSPNYTNTPCTSYDVSAPLGSGQVYVVVAKAGSEGVSGASFGVAYNGSSGQGIDPRWVTWTPCADGGSFPSSDGVHGDFPQPGGGLRITWNVPASCQLETIEQHGVHAVVGSFYVYAYSNDLLSLTPNYNVPGGPEAAVASCAGVTTNLVDVWGLQTVLLYLTSQVAFGSGWGCNPCWVDGPPCIVTPVAPTTWGKLKTRYQDEP